MDDEAVTAGLCERCAYSREVTTGRGGRFLLCRRSLEDSSFPRYPVLPVIQCNGFQELDDA